MFYNEALFAASLKHRKPIKLYCKPVYVQRFVYLKPNEICTESNQLRNVGSCTNMTSITCYLSI